MIVQRARPMLGTLVQMRVEGFSEGAALRAIESAFAEVAAVHRCMSFHESDSDLSHLHRTSAGTLVQVDARTHAVLACALDVAAVSAGLFDPTIAAQQVARGWLPRPDSAFSPDPRANWRDIELLDQDCVRLHRPLWIDLGGIAKGYAVDRAVEILVQAGATQGCVNAGGDLRVFGPRAERIHLRSAAGYLPALELCDAAVAGSTGAAHVHGRTRAAAHAGASVGVVAPTCMIADALTKVVLAAGVSASAAVLARFAAQACAFDTASGWQVAA
jgi:thiamine biosynthesis lipoprotein